MRICALVVLHIHGPSHKKLVNNKYRPADVHIMKCFEPEEANCSPGSAKVTHVQTFFKNNSINQ